MTLKEYTPWAEHLQGSGDGPIHGDGVSWYLNREDVRAALNIPTEL
jgi:hypothetical protein